MLFMIDLFFRQILDQPSVPHSPDPLSCQHLDRAGSLAVALEDLLKHGIIKSKPQKLRNKQRQEY